MAAASFATASPTRITDPVSSSPSPFADTVPSPVIPTVPALIHSARQPVAPMSFPFRSIVTSLSIVTVDASAMSASSVIVSPEPAAESASAIVS